MAETLTLDNKSEAEVMSDAGELTSEEQDSLAIGENLVEQQEQLLAGKYKNAEELEKAYVELQQKFGDNTKETPEVTDKEVETPEDSTESEENTKDQEPTNDYSLLEKLWEEANSEFTEETTDKLSSMDIEDIVNMHLAYRKNVETSYIQPKSLSESQAKDLQNVAGGPEQYKSMINWASENLSEEEVGMFDQVMERGDLLSSFFAIRALSYRYEDSVGRTGEMITGTAPKESKNIFRSQAEVVAAMSDKRYDNDPAYRQDIMKKLERSPNVEF